VGLLKVGEKNLFIHDYLGRTHEMSPLCVLDFFVSETEQRKGYGKQLFDCMLRMQNVLPEHLAIDKPSEKSIRFLRKHYNLKNPIGQVNNFVVFDGFFDNRTDQNNTNLFGKRKQSGSNKQQQQRIYDVLSAVPSSIQQYGSTRSNSNYVIN
jgi:alpha-tubulin N-acetyltransferase 1